MKNRGYILVVVHLCALLAIILSSIQLVGFDSGFYKSQYLKRDTAGKLALQESELQEATEILLAYTLDKRQDLDYEITFFGEKQQFYNQREKEHMADVKMMYKKAIGLRNTALVLCLIGLLFLQSLPFLWYPMLKQALMFSGIILAFLGFYAFVDFGSFWQSFHLLFFSNDLWILNPATDRLIVMVPLGFFMILVVRVFCYSLLGIISYSLLVKIISEKRGKSIVEFLHRKLKELRH